MEVNFEKVKSVIVEKLGCDPDMVKPETPLLDLGADSLDAVELIMSIEEEYNVEIADDEAEAIKTVQDVLDLVKKKLG